MVYFSAMQPGEVIVFDVETTGTDRRRDQVIELCVQLGLDADAESITWRMRTSVPISPGAQAVHGISMEELAECPPFAAYAERIRTLFGRAHVLIGYNMSFDIGMLQAEYARLRQPPLDFRNKKIVDAFRLWQRCEPRSLQHAHQRFVGDSFAEAHSATADVAATGRVLQGMLESFGLADQDWSSIAHVCEPERASWVGPSRHIRWSQEEGVATGKASTPGVPPGTLVIGFGRHANTPVHVLARTDNGNYLRWMLSKDFPPHVLAVCGKALELPADDLHAWARRVFGSDKQGNPAAQDPSEPAQPEASQLSEPGERRPARDQRPAPAERRTAEATDTPPRSPQAERRPPASSDRFSGAPHPVMDARF